MTVYASSQPGPGTTSSLAEHVRNLDASHISIWCEIAETADSPGHGRHAS